MYPQGWEGWSDEERKAISTFLASFNPELTQKPQIVALNKMDLPGAPEAAETFVAALTSEPVFLISAKENQGIKRLISRTIELLDKSGEG